MIVEIPTPQDYKRASLSQLHLAWQIATAAVFEYDARRDAFDLESEELRPHTIHYLKAVQPSLGNALSLVQQAMELALKGKISALSPFLLIAGNPRDWPKASGRDVPFSDFRTIDAADLIKVHNLVCPTPLDEHFVNFWNDIRRERNKIMHTAFRTEIFPGAIIREILYAASTLHPENSWGGHLINIIEQEDNFVFGMPINGNRNVILDQFELAIRFLNTSDAKRYLGFFDSRRRYLCPKCWDMCEKDYQDEWPALAQLCSRAHNETSLKCVVCSETMTVERRKCGSPDECKGNVIYDEMCLSCTWSPASYRHSVRA